MKRILLSCLLMLSFALAGCAGKSENQADNNGYGIDTPSVINANDSEYVSDYDEASDLNAPDNTLDIDSDADGNNNDTDSASDLPNEDDDDSAPSVLENYWSIGTVYEDGSIDLVYDDDSTSNSNDFTSSTRYVRIIDQFVYGDSTPSKLFDIAREYPGFAEGDYDMNVTQNLTLPKLVDKVKITWTSSDESLITNDGIVKRPHEHSKYVMLTAVLSDGEGELISRYIIKVARDMYDDVTDDMILGLTDDYGNWEKLEEMGIDLFAYDGWFYYCDELEQLYFFQGDLDRILLYDDPGNKINPHIQCTGDLFEVRPETHHEVELAVSSLRTVIYCDDKYELKCDRSFPGLGDDCYDFIQYYNGIPTTGMIRLGIGHDEGSVNWFNSWMLQIPDGFDTTVKYSEDKLKKDYELLGEPELKIDVIDDKFMLIWTAYTTNHTCIIVDAKSGELIEEYSTVIID